jgi:hydrogenase nickel incorporation protein HypB
MCAVRVIDVNMGVFEMNDRIADEVRARNKANGTFMVNLMASPGSGKTTTLLRTIADLRDEYKIGVMEADIDASVDAEKMIEAGVRSIQIHTGGECAMDASMTQQALNEFDTSDLDLLFMENVGNLVCTAEQDTGATVNVEILSLPEGDDKPLKYPLMFTKADVVVVNKIDAMEAFDFNTERFKEYVAGVTKAPVFFVSAATGEGIVKLAEWLHQQADALLNA